VGSLLTLLKIFGLPQGPAGLAKLAGILPKAGVLFFNPDDPQAVSSLMSQNRPDLVIGPSFLKNLINREGGDHEIVLPSEGTYATLYVASLPKGSNEDLAIIFLNHLTDPMIQKNLSTVMNVGVTNQASLPSMAPVLYNALKMNDPAYLTKNLVVLKDAAAYEDAVKLFREFRAKF
jgi:spermidine/putrescine-binding protein